MEQGSYARKINFVDYKTDKFVAHLFPGTLRCMGGCGSTALGLITGVDPLTLPHLSDWTRKYVISFLLKRGFKVAKLTQRNLTNSKALAYPVGSGHVILMRIKFIKKEASWVVVHNGKMYHNFDISEFRGYELVNHPVLTAYLIKHPSWDAKPTEKDRKLVEKKFGIKLRPRRKARRLQRRNPAPTPFVV